VVSNLLATLAVALFAAAIRLSTVDWISEESLGASRAGVFSRLLFDVGTLFVTSPTVLKLIVFSTGAAGWFGLKDATAAANSADVAGASTVLKLIVFSTAAASCFGLNDDAAAIKSADGEDASFTVTLDGAGVSVLKEIVLSTVAAGWSGLNDAAAATNSAEGPVLTGVTCVTVLVLNVMGLVGTGVTAGLDTDDEV
jgi:hypothetical protein